MKIGKCIKIHLMYSSMLQINYNYQNFASSISVRQCNTMNTVMDTINIYSRHFDFSEKYALMSSNM